MTEIGTESAVHPDNPVREEILQHAMALFSHFGYGKTNIGDIAARVGMSPANLYRHFRNKQAIGEEVVRIYMKTSEATMAASLLQPLPDAGSRLRAVCHAGIGELLRTLSAAPRMVELAEMICQSESGILAAHLRWKLDLFERLIREGVDAGEFRALDPAATAEALLDATRAFWMPMALARLDPARVPGRVDAILDLALAGMRRGA